jgi:lipopolysaccharide/colanic/teichoic acid biosynthesis glycosyltransferase
MRRFYTDYVKRILDIICSLFLLVILLPFFVIVIMLVRFRIGSPVFFIQQRPGLNGAIFSMIKFRTMTNKMDTQGNLLPDSERLTPLGVFLRSSSIDELPELLNVFKGDMSLIGPRPLLSEYLPLYNSFQERRHEVRPGITGLAQISGRNALSWDQKFELDVRYVDNISFGLDLKILLMTISKVIKREGINKVGEATMSKFEGN